MHRKLQSIRVQWHKIFRVFNFCKEQNNGFIDYKTAKKRNYKCRTLTSNKKETPLHGPYTPQAGGVLTDEIDTAEHFK
jgi:hypothetical protein